MKLGIDKNREAENCIFRVGKKNKNMKNTLIYLSLLLGTVSYGQSVVQSINSGSVIAASSNAAVGEIVVLPQSNNQPSTGLIGILAQLQQQNLETTSLVMDSGIAVYPNPTTAELYFKTTLSLENEKVSVFNTSGQMVQQMVLTSKNNINLSNLSSGIYLITFENKKLQSFKIIKH